MAKRFLAVEAIKDILNNNSQPVITDYLLGVYIYDLYHRGRYKGQAINKKIEYAGFREYKKILDSLLENNILTPVVGIHNVYKIFGKTINSEEEIVCSVDPFSYISHLSAMEFHGITDKISKTIIYSSPAPGVWKKFAKEKMLKDYNEAQSSENPLIKLSPKKINKFGKKHINRVSSNHMGAYINIKGANIRVSSIGKTFLDMLRKPDLCGGIHNVVEAYEEFGGQYLNLIIDEVDRNGSQIEKVRAGYIFDEVCGIDNETIESWTEFAQRGGSRKLDPNNSYSPNHSKKWSLSINAEL